MSTLIAVGDSVDRIVSWGALVTSNDGRIWSSKTNPFDKRGKCRGIAVGTINSQPLYYAIGDGGLVSSSTDRIHWTTDKIWFGNFQPLSIVWGPDNAFYVCGQFKFFEDEGIYKTNDEVAVVMRNSTGNHWDWQVVYTHRYTNSRLYNIRIFQSTVIALGSEDNKPIVIYSSNSGLNWSKIELPKNLNIKHAYDICFWYDPILSHINFWITTNELILKNYNILTNTNLANTWVVSRSFEPTYGTTDFVKIASNDSGHIVAVCSGGIAYTTDQFTWKFLEQPGYSFRSVTDFNNMWIVGAESLLTHYTHWTSTDTENWTPDNCGVQIFDSTVI